MALVIKFVIMFVIMVSLLVTGQWLMDAPSSGGDLLVWLKHTAGVTVIFCAGIFSTVRISVIN